MRKDELLYLHHLLALSKTEFEQRGVASPETFARYEDVGVGPMAIYSSKGDHRRAVRALASDLAAASEDRERAVPPT